MKVSLVFPPAGSISQPYLSIPTLAAFLKKHNHEVFQIDSNINSYLNLFSRERLSISFQRIQSKQLEKNHSFPIELQRKYDSQTNESLLCGDFVVNNIETAKKILKDPIDFYDFDKFHWSIKILDHARKMLSTEFFPTKLIRNSYQMRNEKFQPIDNIDDAIQATFDKKHNIFLEYFEKIEIPRILKDAPQLVGISITYLPQFILGLTMARLLKKANPKLHICLGGAFLPHILDGIVKNTNLWNYIDFIITNEGETPLLQLIECLENDKQFDNVPNLIYKHENSIKISTNFSTEDLDQLPTPEYNSDIVESYLSPKPVILVSGSRGCYYNDCAFCTVSSAMDSSIGYRARKMKLLVEDMKKLQTIHNTELFFLSEDAVGVGRLLTISKAIETEDLSFVWEAEVRLEKKLADKKIIQKLANGGLKRVMFGMESPVQRVIDAMEKNTDTSLVSTIVKNCFNHDISVDLLTFVGFPTETHEEAKQTLDFLISHKNMVSNYTMANFQLEKGSSVDIDPKKYGVVNVSRFPEKDLIISYPYTIDSGLTMDEANELVDTFHNILTPVYPHQLLFGIGSHILCYLHGKKQTLLKENKLSPVFILDKNFLKTKLRQSDGIKISIDEKNNHALIFNTNRGDLLKLSGKSFILFKICLESHTIKKIIELYEKNTGEDLSNLLKNLKVLNEIKEFVESGLIKPEIPIGDPIQKSIYLKEIRQATKSYV